MVLLRRCYRPGSLRLKLHGAQEVGAGWPLTETLGIESFQGSVCRYDLRLLRIRESWKVPLCFHKFADDGNYLSQLSVVEARGDGLTGWYESRHSLDPRSWDSPRALHLVSPSGGNVIRSVIPRGYTGSVSSRLPSA